VKRDGFVAKKMNGALRRFFSMDWIPAFAGMTARKMDS
jgi:hypothetical protein